MGLIVDMFIIFFELENGLYTLNKDVETGTQSGLVEDGGLNLLVYLILILGFFIWVGVSITLSLICFIAIVATYLSYSY